MHKSTHTTPQTAHPSEEMRSCVSSYRLDRHFLGADSPTEREQISAHIRDCPHCQQQLHQLKQYAKQALPAPASPQHVPWWERLGGWGGFRGWRENRGWGYLAAALGMFALAVFGWPWFERLRQEKPEDGYSLVRGESPQLRVIRKRGALVEQVRSGDGFLAGDLLRLVVRWRKGGFVYILHRDAVGQRMPLYPPQKTDPSLRLDHARSVELPGSLEVEGPPKGNEEIAVCFSDAPRRFEEVAATLENSRQSAHSVTHHPSPKAPCLYTQHFVLFRAEAP